MRRATQRRWLDSTRRRISIHALLAESDQAQRLKIAALRNFYPRSPCGERRESNKLAGLELVFLSTLSLRRATASNRTARREQHISIHALLAESDFGEINTRGCKKIFLSTLSLRRATSIDDLEPSTTHFYPRSPCGERQ